MTGYSPVKPTKNNRRPRETDWRLFLRLLPYAQRSGRTFLISMMLLIPFSFSGAIQPVLIGETISLITNEPNTLSILQNLTFSQGLNLLVFLLFVTIILRLVLQSLQLYLLQEVGQRITADIRNDLYIHVTALAARFFDQTPVGKMITRLTSDVEALGELFSNGAIGIVTDLFSILIIIKIMFARQWQLALMLLMLLLPITALVIYFQQRYRQANYTAREELSNLNAQLQENIIGLGVVQVFRREVFNANLFRDTNKKYVHQMDKTIFYDAGVSASLEWIALVASAGVLWLGGLLVLDKTLAFGQLSEFILFSQRLFVPLRQFADKFTAIQAGLTSIERVTDIFNQPIEINDPETSAGEQLLEKIKQNQSQENSQIGEIRFENVTFGYKPDEYVIKNLNFTIKPGEKIALVGPTGSGKSTIIRLLCRLYEANEGRIMVDGINVRDLKQAELRKHIGVIIQDGFIFAGDVKSNITLGESYSFEEICQAAEDTKVASFIENLPNGYDTKLRERGTNLSGGQKQLLAFARSAIRNPEILVLDEATANLDVKTEALIKVALDKLLENRTAIIIAHRLSTIKNVDRILVLKRGELVESGTHEELMNQGGFYASLYNLQFLGLT